MSTDFPATIEAVMVTDAEGNFWSAEVLSRSGDFVTVRTIVGSIFTVPASAVTPTR